MKLSFYKIEDRWYADLPAFIEAGGEEADCEMVFGADTWLDKLSERESKITLEINTDSPHLKYAINMLMKDDYGAVYYTHMNENKAHLLWLCPVTLFVFGHYPQTIYYEPISL